MDDVRYSELLFLSALAKGEIPYFCDFNLDQSKAFSPRPGMYVDMAATLIEDLYVRFSDDNIQLLVPRLRGELSPNYGPPGNMDSYLWQNPRASIREVLMRQNPQRLSITYRGLRRIEELRDHLRRDRILEPLGVLLDKRYFLRDLDDALLRGSDTPVSVIYADMDNFKPINTEFGH